MPAEFAERIKKNFAAAFAEATLDLVGINENRPAERFAD